MNENLVTWVLIQAIKAIWEAIMANLEYVVIWLFILTVLIIIEALTTNLTTIWFVGGCLVALVAALLGGGLIVQIVLFLVISILLLLLIRPLVLRHVKKSKHSRTNVESLLGESALVSEEIDNIHEKGHVRLNGKEWVARSLDGTIIQKDTIVIVHSIDGNKLIVFEKKGEV